MIVKLETSQNNQLLIRSTDIEAVQLEKNDYVRIFTRSGTEHLITVMSWKTVERTWGGYAEMR